VANDLVHYDGSIWCCLIDDTVGITPTEGVNWRFWVEDSQKGISDIVNVLGAKNLIPFPYADGTSKTRYNITFTVGEKGKVTVSGTSTGAAQFFFIRGLQLDNPAILSLKSDGAGTNIILVAFDGSTFYTANTSKSKVLPIGTYNVYLLVQEGSAADDTVYPMIRPSGIEDDTYVPYAKTNKELTEEVTQNTSDIQTLSNNVSANATAIQTLTNELTNRYILAIPKEVVEVTADGVKTYQALMKEVIDAVNTYLNAHQDRYIRMLAAREGASFLTASSATQYSFFNYQAAITVLTFSAVTVSDSNTSVYNCMYSTTLANNYYRYSIDSGTITDASGVKPSNGSKVGIYFDVYEKL
jgi:hypothetical protein